MSVRTGTPHASTNPSYNDSRIKCHNTIIHNCQECQPIGGEAGMHHYAPSFFVIFCFSFRGIGTEGTGGISGIIFGIEIFLFFSTTSESELSHCCSISIEQ